MTIEIKPNKLLRLTQENKEYATGWFVVAKSRQLRKRNPITVKLMGNEWVLFRDKSGQPVLMQSHCSHLGANLAGGKVVDGCIKCPFHAWLYNSAGECVSIPGNEYIPQTAKQTVLPIVEQYGFIWHWHGSAEPLFELPLFPSFDVQDEKFLSIRFSFRAKTPVRRVVENFYDGQHDIALHKLPTDKVEISASQVNDRTFVAHISANIRQYLGPIGAVANLTGMNFSKFDFRVTSTATMHIVKAYLDGVFRFTSIVAVTPVDTNETIQQVLIMVKRGKNPIETAMLYGLFAIQSYFTGKQDVPVWDGIVEPEKPVFVKTDKPVLQFREFYQNWLSQTGSEGR